MRPLVSLSLSIQLFAGSTSIAAGLGGTDLQAVGSDFQVNSYTPGGAKRRRCRFDGERGSRGHLAELWQCRDGFQRGQMARSSSSSTATFLSVTTTTGRASRHVASWAR